MDANQLGTRCAWCTRVKDGGRWVAETAEHSSGATDELRWSHGICPDCADQLSFVQAPQAGESPNFRDL